MNIEKQDILCETAHYYSDTLGISVLPVMQNKIPNVSKWAQYQKELPDTDTINYGFYKNKTTGLGLICGKISGNLQCLDEDTGKNDPTGLVHKSFVKKLYDENAELAKKLVVEKTINGGFHYLFKCVEIAPNEKLASIENKVVFETRSEGSYFVCAPSPGYELLQGSFENIPEITTKERHLLLNIARSFDEKPILQPESDLQVSIETVGMQIRHDSPFRDYNENGSKHVIDLLTEKGWSVTGMKDSKIFLLRPGDTVSPHSGNYDSNFKKFHFFSTSIEFKTDRSYSCVDMFQTITGKNNIEIYAVLLELGYGKKKEKGNEQNIKIIENISNIDVKDKILMSDIELLSMDTEECRYLLSPLLPETGTAVIAGQPDSGKSQLVRQLCIAISSADIKEFLGFPLTKRHNRSLRISTEDDSFNTSYCLRNQLKGINLSANGNLSVMFASSLSQEQILIEIENYIVQHPVDIICIDSFNDVFSFSNNNDNIAMRRTVSAFDHLARKCLVLFVHHINKNNYSQKPTQQGIQGGSGLLQKVRTGLILSPGENNFRYLSCVKGNYTPRKYKEKSIELLFDEKHFTFITTGCVVATDSINNNNQGKDYKIEKLQEIAKNIFDSNDKTISNKQFVEKYSSISGKGVATANRLIKNLKELSIIEKEGKQLKLKMTE
jgi:archaellum biogenesis ATPase FlaH